MKNMQIWSLGMGRFAIGTTGQLAAYVVQTKGKAVRGVRGRRPLLTKGRYQRALNAPTEVRAAFKAALA